MASSREYLNFILEQLSGIEGISWRAMMGEYIIYHNGKIIGGIYDDRFLIKPTKAVLNLIQDAKMEKPYDGAKEMILVDNVEDRAFLNKLIDTMFEA